ncbi:RNA recognition motif domain containing protein [Theileria equi strain WA]|uniref:RNA recognition motif domain containing protein n=1 Tax=Theileria equi strain WA TaxID=1537102 RepID=L0AY71_THEEQ|nr:RNA recognition motif domain containing protein [Theileria equi strain WA]AFZ79946.1 RNA recognition motif domain containing protein [Theileria equi strain WA]|eukprot:XP_004829612.1 RNA recognition motif domain containing protein [Theileria equi strain WA]
MTRSSKCRVYVGNLSWKVKWQELKDHMKQVGDVIRADIIEDYIGRSKGCGIVEFADEETAARAISELNDTLLMDRQIFVREDREGYIPRAKAERRSDTQGDLDDGKDLGQNLLGVAVIVTNLQWKTTWKTLKDLFRNCGMVVRADVLTHEDGRSKGVGKVVFADEIGAKNAISMYNDHMLDGRRIGVRFEN